MGPFLRILYLQFGNISKELRCIFNSLHVLKTNEKEMNFKAFLYEMVVASNSLLDGPSFHF